SLAQRSKRLSRRALGWFTGWFYFWAGLLTVSAVAATVPLVVSSVTGVPLSSPDPTGITNMGVFIGLLSLLTSTIINVIGVRILSIINNIGVEIGRAHV